MNSADKSQCPFCSVSEEQVICAQPLAFARRDAYPISPGHSLIIPRRHVASFFDKTPDERLAILELQGRSKALIDEEHQPEGYNIGINDGAAAGQTVMHLHVHLIPRYAGDTSEPRGGVRWIIPAKAPYWERNE